MATNCAIAFLSCGFIAFGVRQNGLSPDFGELVALAAQTLQQFRKNTK
jgi:hypothetical protein